MIGWLAKWWAKNQAERRGIFVYRCGQTAQHADPLVISNELDRADPEWEMQLVILSSAMPAGLLDDAMRRQAEMSKKSATERIVKATRSAFKLEPIGKDGQGVTDLEVIEIVSSFVVFLGGLAAAAAPFAGRPESVSMAQSG